MTKRKLVKAVDRLDIQKKDLEYEIPGTLGFTIDGENAVSVATRPGFVWVRLRNNQNEVIQAYNDQVSTVYGLPVLVTRDRIDKGRYKVVGRDVGQYQNWGSSTPYLPKHGNQHSFNPDSGGGGDIVWVFGRQFMPLLGYPSGSSASAGIIIHNYTYYDGSSWNYVGNTGTADLTTYKPTGSNARIVLVYINEFGNPDYRAGSYFDASITGSAEIVPYIPNPPTGTAFPVSAVRLVSGTSTISWGNLYDIRPFYDLSGTSSGLGGAGGGAPDDASYVTLGLDGDLSAERQLTTGTHTTVTDGGANGTVAINVSPQGAGSGLDADTVDGLHAAELGGGGSDLLVYEDGAFQVTGTSLNFEDQLSVDVTGSTAHIGITQGAGSGLDADTLDGVHATAFSSGSHTHYQAAITDLQHALVITEDSVFRSTGTAIDFGTNMNVAVTGSVVFVSSIDTVGGGGGDLLIYDDSVFNVTGTAISFDDNLTVHVTGSVAYIEGAGATGSAGPPGDNTLLIYDDSVFQVTGSSISFDDGLSISNTGSIAFVNYDNIGARVYNSANLLIPNNVNTVLSFNAERWDTDNIHSLVTGSNSRLTCQTAGVYLLFGHMAYDSNATGARDAKIRLNGTTIISNYRVNANTVGGLGTTIGVTTAYNLSINDYVELLAYQTSGGDLNVLSISAQSPEFGMQRIG